MEITKTITTREGSSWREIAEALRAGRAKELLNVGDRLTVNHSDYGLMEFDVLDFDRDMPVDRAPCSTVTLQLHNLALPELPFDEDSSNSWEKSSLRAWLNRREFIDGFEPEFASLITPVSKATNPGVSGEEHTEDSFFLLSVEEIIRDNNYAYYKNARNLVKFNPDDEADWWWLRSANRGGAGNTWCVSSSGCVYASIACIANRCAPACVIC